mgnify:CR=1 FL=1
MSGPNKDYDPVEVTPLKAEEVEAMRDMGRLLAEALELFEAIVESTRTGKPVDVA